MNVFKIIVPIVLAAILSGCPTTPKTGTDNPNTNTGTGGTTTTFKLTVIKSGEGSVQGSGMDCGNTCSIDITKDDNVLLTATPGAGSSFSGWSGACSGTENCTVTMTTDRTVFANFKSDSGGGTPIDTTKPTVTVSSPATNQTVTAPSLTVTGTATDDKAVTSLEYRLNNAPRVSITPAQNYSFQVTLAAGSNPINIYAKDAAGNEGVSSLNVTYNAPDITNPTVSISSPGNGQTLTTANIRLTGSASDAGGIANIQYAANGGIRVDVGTAPNFEIAITLRPGANTITVYATDNAGNVGSSSITVTYNAPDTTPPTVTIGNPSNGQTLSGANVRGIGFASDAGGIASVQYSINGGTRVNLGSVTGNFEFAIVLQPGVNTITLFATDNAGNVSSTSVNVTYSPPSFTITPEQNVFFVGQKSVAFWKVNIAGRQNFNTSGAAFDTVTLENNVIIGTGASKIQFSYRKTDSTQDEIVLEIGAGSSVPVGDYFMTVRATSGSIVKESAVTVRVAPCSLGCQ
jgi:Divergent InlB B-repeat domain/Glucodextranase, domain B/Bacterial Ig domain